jgi:iron complex transport system ATP-binding protein
LDKPLITAKALGFGHGKRAIGSALDFQRQSGELIALVGPNGAGKTTLLQTLCGFLPPISGEVLIDGQIPQRLTSDKRAELIAYLPQDEEMVFPYSAHEVVSLGLQHKNLTKDDEDEAVNRALGEVDALEFAHRSVMELSGGERQRVRLARAFAQNPATLLLDEPNVHLDPAWQIRLGGWLKKKQEDGMTIIAALHDLRFAASLHPHFLVLPSDGTQPIEGNLKEIIAQKGFERCFQIEPVETDFGLDFRAVT